jgi:hypothetical protein
MLIWLLNVFVDFICSFEINPANYKNPPSAQVIFCSSGGSWYWKNLATSQLSLHSKCIHEDNFHFIECIQDKKASCLNYVHMVWMAQTHVLNGSTDHKQHRDMLYIVWHSVLKSVHVYSHHVPPDPPHSQPTPSGTKRKPHFLRFGAK